MNKKTIIILGMVLILGIMLFVLTTYTREDKNTNIRNITNDSQNNNDNNNNNIVSQVMLELTKPQYGGRINGTEGNRLATLYLAEIFGSIGLNKWNTNSYEHLYSDSTSNVVGVIEGIDRTKAIVITAHFDGVFVEGETFTEGALDNASGVSAMLRIATNVLNLKEKPSTDILFVAFNEEEIGLKGSSAFVPVVKEHYEELYNINIDSIGLKDVAYMFVLNDSMGEHSKVLNQELKDIFVKRKIEYVSHPLGLMSDSRPFLLNNISAMTLAQDVETITEIFHTERDVFDVVDIVSIEGIADAITEFIITNKGKMY